MPKTEDVEKALNAGGYAGRQAQPGERFMLLQVTIGQHSVILPANQKPEVHNNQVPLWSPCSLGHREVPSGNLLVLRFQRTPPLQTSPGQEVRGRIYCTQPKPKARLQ